MGWLDTALYSHDPQVTRAVDLRGGRRLQPVNEVLSAVDAFDAALRARDLVAAQAVWAMDQPDVVIFGSGPGEEDFAALLRHT